MPAGDQRGAGAPGQVDEGGRRGTGVSGGGGRRRETQAPPSSSGSVYWSEPIALKRGALFIWFPE